MQLLYGNIHQNEGRQLFMNAILASDFLVKAKMLAWVDTSTHILIDTANFPILCSRLLRMAGSQRRPWRLARPQDIGNYHAFKECRWNDPNQPCCAICGQLILADPNARNFFAGVKDFNAARNRNYIQLTNADMHEYLAEGKCDWRSTYRARKYVHLSKYRTCFVIMMPIFVSL